MSKLKSSKSTVGEDLPQESQLLASDKSPNSIPRADQGSAPLSSQPLDNLRQSNLLKLLLLEFPQVVVISPDRSSFTNLVRLLVVQGHQSGQEFPE